MKAQLKPDSRRPRGRFGLTSKHDVQVYAHSADRNWEASSAVIKAAVRPCPCPCPRSRTHASRGVRTARGNLG